MFDLSTVRASFPGVTDDDAYLDSAASAQKPAPVLAALQHAYTNICANVHRGVHRRSQQATQAFEAARKTAAAFIGGRSDELVFVRGATEGLNLLANSLAATRIGPGDEVVVTEMEHHANLVPWQMVCQRRGATLRAIPLTDEGALDLSTLDRLLGPKTTVLACVHASNTLGTINPISTLAAAAHAVGALCVVDGAQATPHIPVDVQALGVDAYVYSGHKIYGPTGIGALWARRALLGELPPWQGGGDMIRTVALEQSTYNDVPFKFEAGTPHIAGAVGMAAAIRWLEGLGWAALQAHEDDLLQYAIAQLETVPGVSRVGTAAPRVPLVTFVMEDFHAHDVGSILDSVGVAVRTGHHCTQPVMDRYDLAATVRASFAAHSARDEVDRLIRGLHHVREVLG
ncbi:MAG: SufS family cysteine desulfurase [Myxococcota bacterium]